MTNNEKILIETIRTSSNPEQALMVAFEIITNYLKQPVSFEEQALASLQEHA